MWYLLVKDAHVTLVAISLGLFVTRFFWSLRQPSLLQRSWVRVVPHLVDTLLLVCGLTLMVMLRAWPQRTPWLAVKLVGLCVYIGFGVLAFRYTGKPALRIVFASLAVGVFAYIVAVAITQRPLPWA